MKTMAELIKMEAENLCHNCNRELREEIKVFINKMGLAFCGACKEEYDSRILGIEDKHPTRSDKRKESGVLAHDS